MIAKTPQQKMQTFRGKIENVQQKPTRSGLAMVVFTVNGYPFKAFGAQAEAVKKLDGQHAEITGKHNTFQGKDEYAVFTIAGEVGGQRVAASDTSRYLVASAPQQQLKHSDRHQWNLKAYGSAVEARQVGVWLNQFFDDLSEAEWEQWKKYSNSQWPIHEADRQADREHKQEVLLKFKEDYERRHGKPYAGNDVDVLCSCSSRRVPQDLESVKARFYARLNEVREALRCKASASSERPDQRECHAPEENAVPFASAASV